MIPNMDKLRAKIIETRTTQEAIAKAIGLDRTTFSRKINSNGGKFTIGEVHKIIKAIPLSKEEAVSIFFGQ